MTTRGPWGLMCEICFRSLTVDECALDEHGDRWDVCAGRCAREAGIVEAEGE